MPKCLWKEGGREGNALLLKEISIRVCKGNPLLHVVDPSPGKGFARENASVDFEEVRRRDLLILGEERGRGQLRGALKLWISFITLTTDCYSFTEEKC